MLDTVVISGEDCCGTLFCTLVGVSVFRIIWSEFLMTSALVVLYDHHCKSVRELSVH